MRSEISSSSFPALAASARPNAGMQLNSGGRGEDGRLGIGIQRIERRDALARLRIQGRPRIRQVCCEKKTLFVSVSFFEARLHFGFDERAEFGGHTGKQNSRNVAIRFEPQARRGAARIREDGGAFGHHGLAFVDRRHRAAVAARNVPECGAGSPASSM